MIIFQEFWKIQIYFYVHAYMCTSFWKRYTRYDHSHVYKIWPHLSITASPPLHSFRRRASRSRADLHVWLHCHPVTQLRHLAGMHLQHLADHQGHLLDSVLTKEWPHKFSPHLLYSVFQMPLILIHWNQDIKCMAWWLRCMYLERPSSSPWYMMAQ